MYNMYLSIKKISAVLLSSALLFCAASCATDISAPPQTSDSSLSSPAEVTDAPASTPGTSVTTVTTSETTTAAPEPEPGVYGERSFPAEEQYVKLIGRTRFNDGTLWLSYSASGIEFTFNGDKASVTILGDSSIYGDENNRARFAVYVNGVRTMDEMVTDAEKTYDIFSADEAAETDVKILKLSEPACSSFGIKQIDAFSYGDITPAPEKDLKIEFIGDSITCGYGIDDNDHDHHFSTATEDATKTYACKTAELLDADYSLVSFSGNGILSGFTNNTEKKNTYDLLPKKYSKLRSIYTAGNKTVSEEEWDHGKFETDIVVINLGTNDATYTNHDSQKELEFEEEYVKFLKTVRENNPNAHIVCTLGMISDDLFPSIEAAATYYTADTGDANISTLKFTPQDGSLGYGADWHPSEGTNEVAANLLVEHIKSLNIL